MKLSTLFFLITIATVPTIHAMWEGIPIDFEKAKRDLEEPNRSASATRHAMPYRSGGSSRGEGFTPEESTRLEKAQSSSPNEPLTKIVSVPGWSPHPDAFLLHLETEGGVSLVWHLARQALSDKNISSEEQAKMVNLALVALLRHNESTPTHTTGLAQDLLEEYLKKELPLDHLNVQAADRLFQAMQYQSKTVITAAKNAVPHTQKAIGTRKAISYLSDIMDVETDRITKLQELRNIILSRKS